MMPKMMIEVKMQKDGRIMLTSIEFVKDIFHKKISNLVGRKTRTFAVISLGGDVKPDPEPLEILIFFQFLI